MTADNSRSSGSPPTRPAPASSSATGSRDGSGSSAACRRSRRAAGTDPPTTPDGAVRQQAVAVEAERGEVRGQVRPSRRIAPDRADRIGDQLLTRGSVTQQPARDVRSGHSRRCRGAATSDRCRAAEPVEMSPASSNNRPRPAGGVGAGRWHWSRILDPWSVIRNRTPGGSQSSSSQGACEYLGAGMGAGAGGKCSATRGAGHPRDGIGRRSAGTQIRRWGQFSWPPAFGDSGRRAAVSRFPLR